MSTAFLGWHFHLIGTSFPLWCCKASFLVWSLLLPQGLNTHPQVCSQLWLLSNASSLLVGLIFLSLFPACITSCLMLFSALLIFCQPLRDTAPGLCWSYLWTCTHSLHLCLCFIASSFQVACPHLCVQHPGAPGCLWPSVSSVLRCTGG